MSTLQSETKTSRVTTAIVRFAGDSGDGMQLAGMQFTKATGIAGNDLMTFPDFPAEIRAPQGTMAGVSGFQIHFGSDHIHTPGDRVDVLVAMNPAALKANLKDLRHGGTLIVNTNAFDERALAKVQYDSNPLEDPQLRSDYNVVEAPISDLNKTALEDLNLTAKEVDRSKNFFALGITFWLFQRDMQPTMDWIASKFRNHPKIQQANERVLKAGYNFAETCELFQNRYELTRDKFLISFNCRPTLPAQPFDSTMSRGPYCQDDPLDDNKQGNKKHHVAKNKPVPFSFQFLAIPGNGPKTHGLLANTLPVKEGAFPEGAPK